jgi:hypothetical protein
MRTAETAIAIDIGRSCVPSLLRALARGALERLDPIDAVDGALDRETDRRAEAVDGSPPRRRDPREVPLAEAPRLDHRFRLAGRHL